MKDVDIYERGLVVWHSSDEDGSGPDVGISVGLGDVAIYAGEVPGQPGPWSLCIYRKNGPRADLAGTVSGEDAVYLIERIGIAVRSREASHG